MEEWKVTVCTGPPLSVLPGLWGYKPCSNQIQDPQACSSQEVHRSQFLRLAWPGCNFRGREDRAVTGLRGMGDMEGRGAVGGRC